MSKTDPSSSPEQQLEALRARIDRIDDTVSDLLLERVGVVREVAALKGVHWPGNCYIRPGREGRMHRAIADRFRGTDIPPVAAIAIWRQLIGTSTHLESPLTVLSLGQHPHHGWLGRDYFGALATQRSETCLPDMLDSIKRGEANLLLLPAPGTAEGDWWVDAELFTTHGLSVFAHLPAIDAVLPGGAAPAIALAAITPEPSGNDISYLAVTTRGAVNAAKLQAIAPMRVLSSAAGTHHLLLVEDFLTEDSALLTALRNALGEALLSHTLLGAHPRPLTLEEVQ